MRKLFLYFYFSSLILIARAQIFSYDGLDYTVINDSNVSTKLHFPDSYDMSEIEIPSEAVFKGKTYKVTRIGQYSFMGCHNLKSVVMQNTITSIGYNAFAYCENLTTITIPNSVEKIDGYAFVGCDGLVNPIYNEKLFAYLPQSYSGDFIIPNGIEQICPQAFWNCTHITGVTIPNSVNLIGEEAFECCSQLKAITIPESIFEIQDGAFANCTSLNIFKLPNSVNHVGSSVFSNTPIFNIVCNATVFAYMPTSYEGKYSVPDGITKIAGNAFDKCTELSAITLPESLNEVGDKIFFGCSSLTSIVIPNNLKQPGLSMFANCSNLTDVKLPDSMTAIGACMFDSCTSLQFPAIPENTYIIGSYAFRNCKNLKNISIPGSVIFLLNGVFSGCTNLKSVTVSWITPLELTSELNPFESIDVSEMLLYVPKNTLSLYSDADVWKNFGTIIEYDPTAIDSISVDHSTSSVFNLQGRKLSAPQKGINIIDGKKILVK